MNSGVGNAVPGVPSGAVRKHRARHMYQTAAFGGRNAGDGVPYGRLNFSLRLKKEPPGRFLFCITH
jgi:hypothetical protein